MDEHSPKLILIIRGHVRNSFSNNILYSLIKRLSVEYDIDIFIHTWNIMQSDVSWRQLNKIPTKITEQLIYEYFKDLSSHIKKIIISDDTTIKLIGRTTGNIASLCPCPTISWKRMWYGKYTIIDYVKNYGNYDNRNNIVLNMRFDLLDNSNNIFSYETITDRINNELPCNFTKNIFCFDNRTCGVDNCYFGNIDTMHKLSSHFHFKLDAIIARYPNIMHQEFLVPHENDIL
jgi:hypothetical protein